MSEAGLAEQLVRRFSRLFWCRVGTREQMAMRLPVWEETPVGHPFSAGRAGRGRGFGCLLSLEHRPWPPPLHSLSLYLHPWALNSLAILSLARPASPMETGLSTCLCHLHGTALPASANPPDIPSAHPRRRLSRGGGILSPGPSQGPGHRLPAPQLWLWVVFPGTSTLLAASPRSREERQGQRSCG